MRFTKIRKAGCVALAGALVSTMFVQGGVALASDQEAQGNISGTGTATVTTDDDGFAYVDITIQQEGDYVIASTASQGVNCDTIGTLKDANGGDVASSDDNNADTNFCMSQHLAVGTYKLEVQGKESQAGASITVDVSTGVALNSFSYQYSMDTNGQVQNFQLGTWMKEDTTSWQALDSSNYKVVGYVYADIFSHAQQDGAVDNLQWSSSVPSTNGRFVAKVVATGSTYSGAAYYAIDNVDPDTALSELFPKVENKVCGAVDTVQLGVEANTPTSWNVEWTAVSTGYYSLVGYTTRSAFEEEGGDVAGVTWKSGLPTEVGSYVIKLTATAKSPYEGNTYVWTSIDEVCHVSSGAWIIDKAATYKSEGKRHVVCMYCGTPCEYESVPKLTGPAVGSKVTAGSGTSAAQYKVTTESEVTYLACKSKKKAAVVPATVKLGGELYYVTGISSKAFAKAKKVKTVTIKTPYLVKSTMKKCLKGSKVTTVKVPKAQKSAYKKLFAKGVCGKKVKVK